MVEYLGSNGKLDSPRKQRFPDRYLEDVSRLVVLVTTEILVRQRRDGKDSKVYIFRNKYLITELLQSCKFSLQSALSLNVHLAFFLHDLLSVMDRGFVFSLIRGYCRQLNEEKSLYPHDGAAYVTNLKVKL